MIRLILAFGTIVIGLLMAVRKPIFALMLYTWNAYFRPASWVYQGDLVRSLRLSQVSAGILIIGTLVSRKTLVFNLRVALFWLFLLWAWIGSSLADIPANHAVTISEVWKFFLISYLYVCVVTNVKHLRWVVLTIVLSLGLEAAKQGWATLILRPGGENLNSIPFLGTRNPVAVGMLMLTPLCIAMAQTAAGKWERRFFWLLSIGVLYRSISTYSRGALVAAVALAGNWWWRSRFKIRSLLILGIAVTIVWNAVSDEWVLRMESIFEVEETGEKSATGRFHFWEVAMEMSRDHPIFGVGVNGFASYYDSYDFSFGYYGERRAVHSSWFGLLAETGYVGLAIFIAIFFLALRTCGRIRRKAKKDERYRDLANYAVALEAAFVGWAVGGAFTNFHYNEMLWNFIGLSMVLDNLAKNLPPEEVARVSNSGAEAETEERLPVPVSQAG